MPGGRPRHFDTAEELENKIDEFFITQDRLTITGLAYFLGFESRQSIYDYEKEGEFSYLIKKARLRVEQYYEENLFSNNVSGSIFALKNMGWSDRVETNQNVKLEGGKVTIISEGDEPTVQNK